jgi:hypothetical protein
MNNDCFQRSVHHVESIRTLNFVNDRTNTYPGGSQVGALHLRCSCMFAFHLCVLCLALMALSVLQVYFHPHISAGVSRDQLQHLQFKPCTIMDAIRDLPLKWFECQSVITRRIAIMVLQINSDVSINVIWCGDTFAYRGALSDNNVTGMCLMFNHVLVHYIVS